MRPIADHLTAKSEASLEGDRSRLLLVFPPLTEARLFPYLSLPMIAAHLRANGKSVHVADLNIDLAHSLFTKSNLRRCIKQTPQSRRDAYRSLTASYLFDNYDAIIEGAFGTEANRQTSLPIRFFQRGVDLLLEGSQLAEGFTRFEELAEKLQRVLELRQQDLAMNVYRDSFLRAMSPTPKVVAISVAFFSQLLPSFVLATWVKQLSPTTQVILGGQQVMLWSSELGRLDSFGRVVDYLGVGKGETTLLSLLRYLDGKHGIDKVPDLVTPAQRTRSAKAIGVHLDLNDSPAPDFADLPLSNYLSGEIQFPLITCIGCYWGRCVFCSYGNRSFRERSYEQASPEWIASTCESLVKSYGARRINFVDENVNLLLLASALRLLASRGISFQFSTRNRLEPLLAKKEFCRELKDAGCVLMSCGYETNSQRLLDHMDKGLDASTFQQIIDNLDEVGIALRLSVMGGLFDETVDETKQSHTFLLRNEHKVGIDTMQMLIMEPQTFLRDEPQRFGLTPTANGALRGNAVLNYGMGRMGTEFSYQKPESFQSHLERLIALHEEIRPHKNDEWPTTRTTVNDDAIPTSIRLHQWIQLMRDPESPDSDSVLLVDLAWQRFFRVPAAFINSSGAPWTHLTLTIPSEDTRTWREVIDLGLGEPQ